MAPEVSVVIPTYKGATYIQEALGSVFSQTILPAEIIVSDDCSPDNTLEVVRSMAPHSPVPLHLVCAAKNSGGPGRPLNAGIRAARGDLIVVLEHDDVMKQGRIEKQLRALQTFPECRLSIGRFELNMAQPVAVKCELHDTKGQFKCVGFPDLDRMPDVFQVESKDAFRGIIEFNYSVSNSNLTFFKDLWRDLGGFSEKIKTCTDWDFLARALWQTPLAVVNEVILEYRVLAQSLGRKNVDIGEQESRVLCRRFQNDILKHPERHGDLFWEHYWRIRRDARTALQSGRVLSALAHYWKLLRTGALRHHYRQRGGSRPQHS
jgi:glycosyltransferase involved in cell wall biosynthesis